MRTATASSCRRRPRDLQPP
uniref:Uncharacterized protein n=1 Tax=Arundo donax TaxID=35708 RepID=A0A0A9B4Y3_ARUDO